LLLGLWNNFALAAWGISATLVVVERENRHICSIQV
jgi:hypothetical protein